MEISKLLKKNETTLRELLLTLHENGKEICLDIDFDNNECINTMTNAKIDVVNNDRFYIGGVTLRNDILEEKGTWDKHKEKHFFIVGYKNTMLRIIF